MTAALVTVPLRTVSEANTRGGWRPRWRRAREQRAVARMLIAPHVARVGAKRWPAMVVTLTRIAPSRGLDDDNLRGALKAIRDGVADALGIDDGDSRIRWEYAQADCRGRCSTRYAVDVTIAEAQTPHQGADNARRIG